MNKVFSTLLFFIIIGLPYIVNSQVNEPDILAKIDSFEIDEVNVKDINALLQNTERLIKKVEGSLSKRLWVPIDSAFSRKEKFIDQEYEYFNTRDKNGLSKFFLLNTRIAWSNYRVQIQKWQSEIDEQLATNVKNSTLFVKNERVFEKLNKGLVDAAIPVLTKRVKSVIHDINSTIIRYHLYEQELLLLQSRIYDKDLLCQEVLKEVEELESNLRGKTFAKTKPVIWNVSIKNAIHDGFSFQLKRAIGNNNKSIGYHFSSIGYSIFKYLFFVVILIFLVLLVRRNYIKLNVSPETPGHTNVERVLINHPKSIILSLLILTWFVLFPFIPLILSDLFILTLLFAFYFISRAFNDRMGRKLIGILLFLFTLNIIEVIIWYMGDYSRIYLFFETGISVILIYPLFLKYNKKAPNKNLRTKYITKKFIPVIIVLYSIAFLGNIFGFINLTVLFTKIAIRSVAIIMIATGFSRVFTNINFASLYLLKAKLPEFYSRYGERINTIINRIINIVIFIICAEYLLNIFELKALFHEKLGAIFTEKVNVGSISFSLANILLFVGVLYMTYLISIFIKKIIEGEILRKMKLPRGVPSAISMILRIFFVAMGILFAMSAAEIEMNNIVMIFGALGVGIGFGLQSIVLNFISGLILIFERPIQTGDTIEVNSLIGKVKDIGIRASNITTYDGAEVVVPNSNLISNELINWTLSDSRRRVEIKVGTAYGSNPNQVLELLKKVALDHPNVYSNPEPRPLFDGFGDSSLDFRLLFWVHYENGLAAQSDIAVGIYNILIENNIEIPFPQVDLHVKNLPKEKNIEPKDEVSDQKSK